MELGRITRLLILLAACVTPALGQGILPGILNPVAASASCVVPTSILTYHWTASNSAGSSGNPGFNESLASNFATTASNFPTFTSSGTFTQPYLTYNGTSQLSTLTTTIPKTNTTYSFLVVFNGSNVTSGNTFFDGSAATGSYIGYEVASGKQVLKTGNGTTLASGTAATMVSSTSYAIAVTYNSGTGVYAFWKLSGGTATADGSGTGTTVSPANAVAQFGQSTAGSTAAFYQFKSPEIDYFNGTWTSGNATTLATWVNCQYGI